MKRLGVVLILTCTLSVSALAGDVPTAGVASPAPQTGTQSTCSCSSIATTILLTVLGLIR